LKSAEWEKRLIVDTIKTYALISPHVNFSFGEAGKEKLNFFSADNIGVRIKMLYPGNISKSLVHIEKSVGLVKFIGYFSRPDFFEKHHFRKIYVNYRPIKYPRLYRAILDAYQNPKNPPVFLVHVIVDPDLVDVNIHPTKNEVKFRDERYILDLVTQIIKKYVFGGTSRIGHGKVEGPDQISSEVLDKSGFIQEMVIPYEGGEKRRTETGDDSAEFWQLHNTYILAQTKSALIIIDQHVAHERIIYESILKERHGSQRLLFPITLELTPEEYQIFKDTREVLWKLGVEFKEFSSHTVVVDSLPIDAQINREEISKIFHEIGGLGKLNKEMSEIAKVVACCSAIKAGQKLSVIEMQNLFDKLFACKNPYICPHGRPIVLKFTLEELASKFGRT
jgi:DNA mismatch repair protein MutL